MTSAPLRLAAPPYDALLVISFGGPEQQSDVMPFLENVLRGKNVPRERMLAVAHHYERFGGASPINQQNRDVIAALGPALARAGIALPVYWGNRNWHPLLPDTLRQMAVDGRRNALAYITSAYSSYSGCRQYLEDIACAQQEVGPEAPRVSTLRKFFNHPDFIAANADRVRAALAELAGETWDDCALVFTAHSIPEGMARHSAYEAQLRDTAHHVAAAVGALRWDLVYQSRSGPPDQVWLGPDILDHLRALAASGARQVVIAPIGFLSDHVEVLYDLDIEARQVAADLGLRLVRARTVGTHPLFVRMIAELAAQRLSGSTERRAVGTMGAWHDICPAESCLSGRPATASARSDARA
ncbi:MAG TPA: ferrochelatase [Ktedonobacterales bacterium]|nr:ferrochelatase [Ktedonobacterales bacterium]